MSENSKIFKMICFISDYHAWDHTIYDHSCKFFSSYSIYPNLMLASKITWNKIDEYANLFNQDNIKANYETIDDANSDEELKSISSFNTLDFSIEFCLDEKVNEDYFILVFNGDPIFDGEPYVDLENEEVEIYRRIA